MSMLYSLLKLFKAKTEIKSPFRIQNFSAGIDSYKFQQFKNVIQCFIFRLIMHVPLVVIYCYCDLYIKSNLLLL